MNHTRLVSIIKTLVTEAHHSARHSRNPKVMAKLRVPDKQRQVAEEDGQKEKKITGKTMTGQTPNIIGSAEHKSQIEPVRNTDTNEKQNLTTK